VAFGANDHNVSRTDGTVLAAQAVVEALGLGPYAAAIGAALRENEASAKPS
jgi:hypothetical protein